MSDYNHVIGHQPIRDSCFGRFLWDEHTYNSAGTYLLEHYLGLDREQQIVLYGALVGLQDGGRVGVNGCWTDNEGDAGRLVALGC